jgi:5-methylcytosine-specific restriction endonuclease McrA
MDKKCSKCGENCADKYHVDHLVPLAKGGHNNPSNLVIACPHCNDSKGAKLPHEFCGKLF